MFNDVMLMCENGCRNARGEWVQPMPQAHWIAAGFPCDDASCLNSKHRTEEHRLCVAKGGLRTGSVFQAICRYLEESQTECFMFENVCILSKPPCDGDRQVVGPSNLSSVVHLLRASGRWTHVWQLNSTLFGSAQSRPRLWGVSFTLEDLAMDETCAHELLDELMSHCAEVERSALDDFLLPEKHPIVQAQHKEDFEKAFAQPAADSLDIGKLFESAGAVSVSPKARVGGKRNADMEATRPRKRARTSYPGQASPKWSSAHRHAYESLDEVCSVKKLGMYVYCILTILILY